MQVVTAVIGSAALPPLEKNGCIMIKSLIEDAMEAYSLREPPRQYPFISDARLSSWRAALGKPSCLHSLASKPVFLGFVQECMKLHAQPGTWAGQNVVDNDVPRMLRFARVPATHGSFVDLGHVNTRQHAALLFGASPVCSCRCTVRCDVSKQHAVLAWTPTYALLPPSAATQPHSNIAVAAAAASLVSAPQRQVAVRWAGSQRW